MNKGIVSFFLTNACGLAVPRVNLHLIWQNQQVVGDAADQCLIVSAWKVCSADAGLE